MGVCEEMSAKTQQIIIKREQYEIDLQEILTKHEAIENEKAAWLSYITFEKEQGEMARAKLIYERALMSLESDFSFWMQYVNFLQRSLKDNALVRAKFEQKKTILVQTATELGQRTQLIDMMIENALFEEEQN